MLVFTALVTEEGEEGGGDGWKEGGALGFPFIKESGAFGLPIGHLLPSPRPPGLSEQFGPRTGSPWLDGTQSRLQSC